MSVLLDNAASQYFTAGAPSVLAAPMTICGWAKSDDLTVTQQVVELYNIDGLDRFILAFAGGVAGDPARCSVVDGGVGKTPVTTTGYSANVWHHVCAVFASTTSRSIYIDGGSAGTNTDFGAPVGIIGITIGASKSETNAFSGYLSEISIYNAAFSAAQVALHYNGGVGLDARLLLRDNLKHYWKLENGNSLIDIIGGLTLTAFNSPVDSADVPEMQMPTAMAMAGVGV